MVYQNILETIGQTPIINLKKLVHKPGVSLLAKLEGQNPSGSVKDRIAKYMIEQAEKRGELNHRQTILEATSGNMGIALALVGRQKGYRVKIVMSSGMSLERRKILKAYGAELVLTDKKFGTSGAIAKAKELLKSNPKKYWFVDQFNNPDNAKTHYHVTAEEIFKDLKKIDYLVGGVGTAGTIIGLASKFKEKSPQTKIVGVIAPTGYKIQGIQNPYGDFAGKNFQADKLDQVIKVPVAKAYDMAEKVALEEGLFVGMSSGAVIYAAQQLAKKLKKGKILVVLADRGEKYLSTDLFEAK